MLAVLLILVLLVIFAVTEMILQSGLSQYNENDEGVINNSDN
jgi:hypothetical protein